jgi:hypothetical protein
MPDNSLSGYQSICFPEDMSIKAKTPGISAGGLAASHDVSDFIRIAALIFAIGYLNEEAFSGIKL